MEDLETLAKLAKMASMDSGEEFSDEELLAAQEKMKLLFENTKRSAVPGIAIHFSVYLVAFIVIFGLVGFFWIQALHKSVREGAETRREAQNEGNEKEEMIGTFTTTFYITS